MKQLKEQLKDLFDSLTLKERFLFISDIYNNSYDYDYEWNFDTKELLDDDCNVIIDKLNVIIDKLLSDELKLLEFIFNEGYLIEVLYEKYEEPFRKIELIAILHSEDYYVELEKDTIKEDVKYLEDYAKLYNRPTDVIETIKEEWEL